MTARLDVRPFEPRDIEPLARIVSDPEVMRFVGDGSPLTRDQTELWIDRSRANVAHHGYGTAAVIDRSTGTLVGWTGFARPEGQKEEIIYGLSPDVHGRGLGSELLQGLVDYAERLGLEELRALVDGRNIPSTHLLEGAGFRLVQLDHDGEVGLRLYRRELGSGR